VAARLLTVTVFGLAVVLGLLIVWAAKGVPTYGWVAGVTGLATLAEFVRWGFRTPYRDFQIAFRTDDGGLYRVPWMRSPHIMGVWWLWCAARFPASMPLGFLVMLAGGFALYLSIWAGLSVQRGGMDSVPSGDVEASLEALLGDDFFGTLWIGSAWILAAVSAVGGMLGVHERGFFGTKPRRRVGGGQLEIVDSGLVLEEARAARDPEGDRLYEEYARKERARREQEKRDEDARRKREEEEQARAGGGSSNGGDERRRNAELARAYVILGVIPGCGRAEVQRAYRERAKQYHADKHGGATVADEMMKELNAARDVAAAAETKD
jgi:hypothetical protein